MLFLHCLLHSSPVQPPYLMFSPHPRSWCRFCHAWGDVCRPWSMCWRDHGKKWKEGEAVLWDELWYSYEEAFRRSCWIQVWVTLSLLWIQTTKFISGVELFKLPPHYHLGHLPDTLLHMDSTSRAMCFYTLRFCIAWMVAVPSSESLRHTLCLSPILDTEPYRIAEPLPEPALQSLWASSYFAAFPQHPTACGGLLFRWTTCQEDKDYRLSKGTF